MWRFKATVINKIKQFTWTLVFGQKRPLVQDNLRPALKNQCSIVKDIWTNKNYKDFGLERIMRLSLALSLFVFPGLYIKAFFGKYGLLSKKLGVELYILMKLFLPITFFKLNWTGNLHVAIFSGVMTFETFLYLVSLIFLSDEFAKPISYRRSLTGIFINYIEICLSYGVIYSYCNAAIPNFFKEKLTTNLQAVYFSFATSATVGYGDIVTTNAFGQYLIISQIILFLIFVALLINFFASRVHDLTYYNDTSKSKWTPRNSDRSAPESQL